MSTEDMNDCCNVSLQDNEIRVSGTVSGEAARKIDSLMCNSLHFTLDFNDACEISFKALRILMNSRKGGKRFTVINACDCIAEKFEDTGVSSIINICRKPKPLDMSKYQEFGASFLSKAYNSADGDSMIKVYGKRVPQALVAREKAVARAVLLFGLNTPLVGTIYSDGSNNALDFERIPGKRSFSRIISEEPERLEEITVRFAHMCRKLHSTQCDTTIFDDRKVFYRQAVCRFDGFSKQEKDTVLKFVDTIPDATTCLHGDMQLSNVITSDGEDMWIDLSDFGYGYPMLDLGMWYFLAKMNPEERTLDQFHLHKEQMDSIWQIFAKEYFGADTPEKQAESERSVLPFAALHMLYLGVTYGFIPGMTDAIKNILL